MANPQKQKGDRAERKLAKELNRHLARLESNLTAKRVPGSGAFATRVDGHQDGNWAGDVQVLCGGRIVERIEVKCRDPLSHEITIADMNRWREERRILAAKHDRGEFLVSLWATAWDDICKLGGGEPAYWHIVSMPGVVNTRGVTLTEINRGAANATGWAGVVYMDTRCLTELLHRAYGEPIDALLKETP